MTHAEEMARAAVANGLPHLSDVQAIKTAIARHESYVESQKANNPYYFKGHHETDRLFLLELERQLAAAERKARQ